MVNVRYKKVAGFQEWEKYSRNHPRNDLDRFRESIKNKKGENPFRLSPLILPKNG
jgi:hypothetical protein